MNDIRRKICKCTEIYERKSCNALINNNKSKENSKVHDCIDIVTLSAEANTKMSTKPQLQSF